MTVKECADLKLTLTIFSDEEADVAAILRLIAKNIKNGVTSANDVVGCIGSYSFTLSGLTGTAEHPLHENGDGQPLPEDGPSCGGACPTCGDVIVYYSSDEIRRCANCDTPRPLHSV